MSNFRSINNKLVRRARIIEYINDMIQDSWAPNRQAIKSTSAALVVEVLRHFRLERESRKAGSNYEIMRKIISSRVRHYISQQAQDSVRKLKLHQERLANGVAAAQEEADVAVAEAMAVADANANLSAEENKRDQVDRPPTPDPLLPSHDNGDNFLIFLILSIIFCKR